MDNQSSSKGVIITIIILVIVIVGGLLLLKGRSVDNSVSNEVATSPTPTITSTSTPSVAPSVSGTTTAQTSAKTVTVTLTDTGYTPKSVTINKGDTVKWVNNSSGNMWTASARHPDHTVYPVKSEDDCLGSSFDQCANGAKGSTYSFTFTEVGTWGYHNHSNASQFGSVVVK